MTTNVPTSDRPIFPEGYGVPDDRDGLLEWSAVEERLAASLHYWLTSVRPDGTPHTVPRWGVWLDGRFWYDGAPTTRHVRNLVANPAVTLTLEDGERPVIIEGISEATSADADDLGARLAAAFGKYHDRGYDPTADSWTGEDGGGLRVITPRKAMSWTSFPTDCTRFTFPA